MLGSGNTFKALPSADADSSGTYIQALFCGNCLRNAKLEIPKGVIAEAYIVGKCCPNCGCPNLSKRLPYDDR